MSKEDFITSILLRLRQEELDKVKKVADEYKMSVGLTIRQMILHCLEVWEKEKT